MSKFTVMGVELEYEFLDADDLEVFQNRTQEVSDKMNGLDEGLSGPEAMRQQCRIVNEFFDDLFGAGTAQQMFGGKNNLKDHMLAFTDVVQVALESDKEMEDMTNRYSPNRAQRRYDQRHGGVPLKPSSSNSYPNGNRHGQRRK